MKVTIIGGAGRVGSCAAYALQCAAVVSEIQLLDINTTLAEGEALDLLLGSSFAGDLSVYTGDYARAADSDIFLITAGLRRKPEESRLELITRNVSVFLQILDSIKAAGLRKDAHVFVVSNPVDILTQLAFEHLDLPWRQVYGLGTMLDTARFSSLIADGLNVAPTQVKALILGEHGDSMLPVWSSATVNGFLATSLPGCTQEFQNAIFERTKTSGSEMLKKKGGAGWAVGLAIRDVIHAVALNKGHMLPVSSMVQGAYNLASICLSVPAIVTRRGIEKQVEMKLSETEAQALHKSAHALRETLAKVVR